MNKREELLQDYIRLSRIPFHNNVAFAHTKYEVDWKKTAFTMWLGHVHGKPVHFYMMSFDYDGITFMCYKFVAKNPHACVWDESHILLDKYLEK